VSVSRVAPRELLRSSTIAHFPVEKLMSMVHHSLCFSKFSIPKKLAPKKEKKY